MVSLAQRMVRSVGESPVSQRVADRGRLDQAGGKLVEKRLEGVVVVAVDQHHVDVRLLQLLGRTYPAEASAQDQDARPTGRVLVFRHRPGTVRAIRGRVFIRNG